MIHYATYSYQGTTAMQVSATAVRVRGTVYDFQRPVTMGLIQALISKLNKEVIG